MDFEETCKNRKRSTEESGEDSACAVAIASERRMKEMVGKQRAKKGKASLRDRSHSKTRLLLGEESVSESLIVEEKGKPR